MDPFGQNEKYNLNHEGFSALLEDFIHFEQTLLSPFSLDPNNDNESVDLDELFGPEMAAEEENTADRSVHVVGDHNTRGQCVTTGTNAGTQVGNNGKNWVTRRRSRKGPEEEALSKEEKSIKQKEYYRKKKEEFLQMKVEVQRLREVNTDLKKRLLSQPGRLLQRTVSAPV